MISKDIEDLITIATKATGCFPGGKRDYLISKGSLQVNGYFTSKAQKEVPLSIKFIDNQLKVWIDHKLVHQASTIDEQQITTAFKNYKSIIQKLPDLDI